MAPCGGRLAGSRRSARGDAGAEPGSQPRFLVCSAWVPWGPARGVQHRLAMAVEGLGRLGTVDVCVLSLWRPGELELTWPREADPDCRWEPDYAYTIEPPGEVKPWPVRPLGLPVAGNWEATLDHVAAEVAALDLEGPVLSVAIVVDPGEEVEAGLALSDLASRPDPRVELLAVTRDAYAAAVIRRACSDVRVLEVVPDLTDGALRNEALRVARGDYVTFTTATLPLRAAELEALLAAHESGHAIVCANVTGSTSTPGGWADLFLECLLSDPAGTHLPDAAYVSFAREPLLGIGGFDPLVSHGYRSLTARTLLQRGFTAAVSPGLTVDRTGALTVRELLRRRYRVGRGLARSRAPRRGCAGTRPARLLRDLSRRGGAGGGSAHDPPPRGAAELVALGIVATWLGVVREALGAARAHPVDASARAKLGRARGDRGRRPEAR